MDIRHMLASEHANIRQVTDQIARALGSGPDGRDNLFDQFDTEVRRHLSLVEDVLQPALKSDERAQRLIHENARLHRELRAGLGDLAYGDKDSSTWTDRFDRFRDRLDQAFARHSELVALSRELLDPTQAQDLLHKYARAKSQDLRAARYGMTRRGVRNGAILGAILGGVALMAGTALRKGRDGRTLIGRTAQRMRRTEGKQRVKAA